MRVLITGSRKWTDQFLMEQALGLLPDDYDVIVHGAARGADSMANSLAARHGYSTLAYPVDTNIDGPWPGAGPRRNSRMLKDSKPDLCIAFPTAESKGTYDMIDKCRAAGILTLIVSE